eukprot:4054582-Amphidinium_carterae.1
MLLYGQKFATSIHKNQTDGISPQINPNSFSERTMPTQSCPSINTARHGRTQHDVSQSKTYAHLKVTDCSAVWLELRQSPFTLVLAMAAGAAELISKGFCNCSTAMSPAQQIETSTHVGFNVGQHVL